MARVALPRSRAAWLFLQISGAVLPALTAVRLRGEGWGIWSSLVGLLLGSLAVFFAALVMGTAATLPPRSMGIPLAVGGAVFAAGVAFGRPKELGVSIAQFLSLACFLALMAQGAVTLRIAHPQVESSYVTGIVDTDIERLHTIIRLDRVALPFEGFGEVNTSTGAFDEFSRRTLDAGYSGNRRILLERPSLSVALGTHVGQRLCHEGEEGLQCSDTLPGDRRYILDTQRGDSKVLAMRSDRIEVWDYVSKQRWSFSESEGRILWPCFAEENQLLWRVDRGSFPYVQLVRSLDDENSTVRILQPGHEIQCLARVDEEPAFRFVRGRRREQRPSRLRGPGLPETGIDLGFSVLVAAWSADGKSLGIAHEGVWFQRFRMSEGFAEPVFLGPTEPPVMNLDGSQFAHLVSRGPQSQELFVRDLPAGKVLLRSPVQRLRVDWNNRGEVLFVDSWGLFGGDPNTGEVRRIFPRELKEP